MHTHIHTLKYYLNTHDRDLDTPATSSANIKYITIKQQKTSQNQSHVTLICHLAGINENNIYINI